MYDIKTALASLLSIPINYLSGQDRSVQIKALPNWGSKNASLFFALGFTHKQALLNDLKRSRLPLEPS